MFSQNTIPGKFAPVDDKTMLIIGQDLTSVEGYVNSGNFPTPAGVTMYTDLYTMAGLNDITNYGAGDIGLQEAMNRYPNSALSIGFWMREEADGQGEDHPNGLTELVNGLHNDELDKFADFAIRNSPRPIYFRIGYEFDGPWNNYDPNRYKAGYRYIVDYLNEKGVTNIAYVWQSATWGENTPNIIDSYYPGDTYVDYVGLSFFFYSQDFNAANLDYILQYSRDKNKPIMVAEASAQYYEFDQGTYHFNGITQMGSQQIWDQFFRDQLIPFIDNNNDVIRALAWINSDWQSQPLWRNSGVHWGDTRIETDALITSNWNNYINNGNFLHGGTNLLNDLGVTNTPPNPNCNDGMQNGDETGVDCGGTCTPCDTGDGETNTKIEAETASLSGQAQYYNDTSASGGQGVAFLDQNGNGFTINNAPQAQKVEVIYASQNTGGISVLINGENTETLNFNSNGTWVGLYTTSSIDIEVPAGASFQIVNQGGEDQALNIDYLNFINNDSGTGNEPCTGNDIPNATTSFSNETAQGANDGSITFNFNDTNGRTNIEFSIDGGATYPYNVRDNTGSTTISNLSPGNYNTFVRWGNNECARSLNTVVINEGEPDNPGNTTGSYLEPSTGEKMIFIGQDLLSTSDYITDCESCPTPTGVATYVNLANVLLPGDNGALGWAQNDQPLGIDIDWGGGPLNAHSAAVGFPNSAVQIGLYLVGETGNISSGGRDAEIRQMADFFKSLSNTAFYLRIGYEFDGQWNGYSGQSYINAYRRIVDLLKQEGVINVAYVWQSSTSPIDDILDGGREDLLNFYPGDDYVDWFGMSWFLNPNENATVNNNTPSTQLFLANELVSLARQRGKAVMIAESANQGYDNQQLTNSNISSVWDGTEAQGTLNKSGNQIWNEWFVPYFNFINNNDDIIKAITYINADWDSQGLWDAPYEQGYWGDTRIQVNNIIENNWANQINQSGWIHGSNNLNAILGLNTSRSSDIDQNNPDINSIKIYPNPSNGIIQIQNKGLVKIKVTDLNGRLIKLINVDTKTNNSQITMDLRGFEKGIYLITFWDKNKSKKHKKIIIN